MDKEVFDQGKLGILVLVYWTILPEEYYFAVNVPMTCCSTVGISLFVVLSVLMLFKLIQLDQPHAGMS